jgi:hypothetical protein
MRWNGISDDGKNLPAGTYFYRLKVGDEITTGQMKYLGAQK